MQISRTKIYIFPVTAQSSKLTILIIILIKQGDTNFSKMTAQAGLCKLIHAEISAELSETNKRFLKTSN